MTLGSITAPFSREGGCRQGGGRVRDYIYVCIHVRIQPNPMVGVRFRAPYCQKIKKKREGMNDRRVGVPSPTVFGTIFMLDSCPYLCPYSCTTKSAVGTRFIASLSAYYDLSCPDLSHCGLLYPFWAWYYL